MTTVNTDTIVPSPGSDEAQARGCTCPVLDNAHGNGAYHQDGQPLFWIAKGCPLHGTALAQAQGPGAAK